MMSLLGAVFLVVGFIYILKLFKLVERSKRVIELAKQAFLDIRDPGLDDDAKEVALQAHAKQLFLLFFLITLGGIAALTVPAVLIWSLEFTGIISLDSVMEMALSWEFLLASTVLMVVLFLIIRKR